MFGCQFQSGSETEAVIHTDRFTLTYNPRDFSTPAIEAFGRRKELLLTRLETILDVTYDTIIPTKVVREISNTMIGYYYQGKTVESADYIYGDDGHEIAHAVTYRMMGIAQTKAITEGFATFLQLELDSVSAQTKLLNYVNRNIFQMYSSEMKNLFSNERTARLNFKYEQYLKSAAFLEFLAHHYGIEKLKKLWETNVSVGDSALLNQFEPIFGSPFDSLNQSFLNMYK